MTTYLEQRLQKDYENIKYDGNIKSSTKQLKHTSVTKKDNKWRYPDVRLTYQLFQGKTTLHINQIMVESNIPLHPSITRDAQNPYWNNLISHIKTKMLDGKNYYASMCPTLDELYLFWTLIIEKKIETIVNLTGFVENGRQKCDEYFSTEQNGIIPITDPPDVTDNGQINITTIAQKPLNYKIKIEGSTKDQYYGTEYTIEISQNNQLVRTLKIIHCDTWPDHGVPTLESNLLYNIYELLMENKAKNILVHCSAGIGRTGTLLSYITTRNVIQSQVNIKQQFTASNFISYEHMLKICNICFQIIRSFRCHAIQNLEQYKHFVQCIKKTFKEHIICGNINLDRKLCTHKIKDKNYCPRHSCKINECGNSKQSSKDFCPIHQLEFNKKNNYRIKFSLLRQIFALLKKNNKYNKSQLYLNRNYKAAVIKSEENLLILFLEVDQLYLKLETVLFFSGQTLVKRIYTMVSFSVDIREIYPLNIKFDITEKFIQTYENKSCEITITDDDIVVDVSEDTSMDILVKGNISLLQKENIKRGGSLKKKSKFKTIKRRSSKPTKRKKKLKRHSSKPTKRKKLRISVKTKN